MTPYYQAHKEEIKERSKKWYAKNKAKAMPRLKAQSKVWAKNNPAGRRKIEATYKKSHPWVKTYYSIISRCNSHEFYLDKDIKYSITVTELKKLWFRDKAYLMNKPSIHRKDEKKGYSYENCEYLELRENLSRRVFKRRSDGTRGR